MARCPLIENTAQWYVAISGGCQNPYLRLWEPSSFLDGGDQNTFRSNNPMFFGLGYRRGGALWKCHIWLYYIVTAMMDVLWRGFAERCAILLSGWNKKSLARKWMSLENSILPLFDFSNTTWNPIKISVFWGSVLEVSLYSTPRYFACPY